MKKVLLTSIIAAMVCVSANASDGGVYYDTQTETRHTSFTRETVRPVTHQSGVRTVRPCTTRNAQPVRVKTYSEVIDHYQVYQPVTVYQPVGEYAQRRIVEHKPCGCGK